MLQMHFRADLVEGVDGLIREEAVGDIPLCQFDARLNGIVGVADVVMFLVALFDIVQNFQRLFSRRGFDDDFLESAFQRTILLNGVAILVECRSTDTLDGASCQGGFENIGSIHRTGSRPGSDERMNLIHEYDDVRVGFKFFDQRFHTFFKLSAILCSGHNARHVEIDKSLVEEDG